MRSKRVMRRLRHTRYKRESLDGEDQTLLSGAEEGLNGEDEDLVGDDEQYGGDDESPVGGFEMEGSTLSVSRFSLSTCLTEANCSPSTVV